MLSWADGSARTGAFLPNYYTKVTKDTMNGRLKKVDMESRLLKIKKGIDDKLWYPEWDDKERWAAQRALNNALEVLHEYSY